MPGHQNIQSVTVIIPAYRATATLGRAVESLLAQSRAPDEILVVDDGSPEDPASALEPYGSQVTLVRKLNGGAASARNAGIELAHGSLIAFLDADDTWESAKLSRQLEIFERYPEVGLVAGRFFTQRPGEPRRLPPSSRFRDFDRVLNVSGMAAFGIATRVWTSTVVVRREVLGDRRFVSGLEPAEDRDLWVRLVASHAAYLISEPLATAVLEPGSLSRSGIDRDCSNMLHVVRRHADLLGRRGVRKWEAEVYRRWAGVHLSNGCPAAALPHAWSRLRRDLFSPQAWWIFLRSAGVSRPSGVPGLKRSSSGYDIL